MFTPGANGVTEIQTSIPVENGYDPVSGVENFDLLAVSSLDADVPVPTWSGGDGYGGGAIGGVFPHWPPGVEQPPGYGTVTFGQVLVAGDVEPPGRAEPDPPVTLAPGLSTRLRSADRVAELPLLCRASHRCTGVVRLQNRAAKASASGTAAYGRASFSIASGARARVAVRLSAKARSILRRARRLVAYANIAIGGRHYAGLKVTLRRR